MQSNFAVTFFFHSDRTGSSVDIVDIEEGRVMGSRQIRIWLLTVIIIGAAGTLLGAHSPKVPTNVAYVSEEEGGISVIDLSTLKVIRKSETSDLDARGLAVTFDGRYVITSNKNTSDGAVFSTPD